MYVVHIFNYYNFYNLLVLYIAYYQYIVLIKEIFLRVGVPWGLSPILVILLYKINNKLKFEPPFYLDLCMYTP